MIIDFLLARGLRLLAPQAVPEETERTQASGSIGRQSRLAAPAPVPVRLEHQADLSDGCPVLMVKKNSGDFVTDDERNLNIYANVASGLQVVGVIMTIGRRGSMRLSK
jgi:hypothetical protein